MRRILTRLFVLVSFFAASCVKEEMGAGYINIGGVRRLDIKCGFQADMSALGLGKNVWHLFASKQQAGKVDFDYCAVKVSAAPDERALVSMNIYGIPNYGDLEVKFSGSGPKEYEIEGTITNQTGNNKDIQMSGTAEVSSFSFNANATSLNLDVLFNLDRQIRVVYRGPTPNDGKSWR